MFWPFGDRFSKHYNRFEAQARELDQPTIEQQLSTFTYRHLLADTLLRTGIGLATVIGISKIIQPTPEPSLLHWVYLYSLAPQSLAACLLGPTRSIVIEKERNILQKVLTTKLETN